MNNIVFKTATKDDIPELVRMRIAYMIDDFGSITDEEKSSMESQLPVYFEKYLDKQCVAFVAKDGSKVAAVALLVIMEKPANPFFLHGVLGEVLSVYTEPEYRGHGLCRQLMTNLVDYAKEHDLDRVDLSATDKGYPIYKKVGFVDKHSKYTNMTYVISKELVSVKNNNK